MHTLHPFRRPRFDSSIPDITKSLLFAPTYTYIAQQ
jgi:hypothetical protein